MRKFNITQDLITGIEISNTKSDEHALINVDKKELRFNGSDVVRGSDYSVFFIDKNGKKHVVKHDQSWQELACDFNYNLVNDGGVWRVENASDTFAEMKKVKMSEINQKLSVALLAVKDGYTDDEISSWTTQEGESKAWTADNLASTPFLDGIVANRAGMDKAVLAAKVLTNATAFKQISGALIGKKQGFVDALILLSETGTQADIDLIIVDY